MAPDLFASHNRRSLPKKLDRKENQLPNKPDVVKPGDAKVKNSMKVEKDDESKVKDVPKLKNETTKNNLPKFENAKREEEAETKKDDLFKKSLDREQMRKGSKAVDRVERRSTSDTFLSAARKRTGRDNVQAREERHRALAPPTHGITSRTGSMFASPPSERTNLPSATLQRRLISKGRVIDSNRSASANYDQQYRTPNGQMKRKDKDDPSRLRQQATVANDRRGQNVVNNARRVTHRTSGGNNMSATNAANNSSKSKKTSTPIADDESKRFTLSFNVANRGEPAKKYYPQFLDRTTTRLVEEIERNFLRFIPESERTRFLDVIFSTISSQIKPTRAPKKRKVGDEQQSDKMKKPKVDETEKDKEIVTKNEVIGEKEATVPDFDVAAAAKASADFIEVIVAAIGAPMPEFIPSTVINPDDDNDSEDGSGDEGAEGARKKDEEGTNDARCQKMNVDKRSETKKMFKLLVKKAKDLAEPLPDDKRKDHDETLDIIHAKWDKVVNVGPKDWYKLTPRCRHPIDRGENDIQLYIKACPKKVEPGKKRRGEGEIIFSIAEGGAPFASIWDQDSISQENTEENLNPWRVTDEVIAFWRDNFRPLYRVMHTLSVCKFFGDCGILAGLQIFPKGTYELRRKELKIQSNSNTGEKSTMISTSTNLLELEKYRFTSSARQNTHSGCELDASVVVINPLARVEDGLSLINLGTQRNAYGLKGNDEKYKNEWLCLNRISMNQIAAVWCYKCIDASGQTVTEWNIKVAIPALVEHELARRRNGAVLPHVTCKCGQAYH